MLCSILFAPLFESWCSEFEKRMVKLKGTFAVGSVVVTLWQTAVFEVDNYMYNFVAQMTKIALEVQSLWHQTHGKYTKATMLGKELVTQSFTRRFGIAPVLCLQYVVHAHRPLARQQSAERHVHLYTNLNFIFTDGHSWQQRILKGNKVKQQKLWMSWQMPTRRGGKSINFYIFIFTLKSGCPLDLRILILIISWNLFYVSPTKELLK